MIKQIIHVFIILSILLSCEQKQQPTDQKITTADTSIHIDTDHEAAEQPVKHIAFHQDIKELPPSLASFIPEGYTALDTTSGDLNLDQYPDMVLVLKKNGEENTSDVTEHPEKRPLLILLGQSDQSYKLASKSDNAVYCIDCGGMMGDPFMGVVIKKGYFSVEHYGGSSWRWTRIITFKYSPADEYWYLHKDGSESFNAGEPEKVTTTISTTKDFGKVKWDEFDIYKED